jgi:hypothetical protein
MWNSAVMSFSVQQTQVNTDDLKELYGAHRGGAVDPRDYIAVQMAMGVTRAAAIAEYRRHEGVLHAARLARGEAVPPAAQIPNPED